MLNEIAKCVKDNKAEMNKIKKYLDIFSYINNDISNDELHKKDLFIEVEKKKYSIEVINNPLKQTNFKNN